MTKSEIFAKSFRGKSALLGLQIWDTPFQTINTYLQKQKHLNIFTKIAVFITGHLNRKQTQLRSIRRGGGF